MHEEFDNKLALTTQKRKKRGRIVKIILFGSHARHDFVEDAASGYLSDYDILIVVNADEFCDVASYWYEAEDRLLRDSDIAPDVNFIVHSKHFINSALSEGRYFFTDIAAQGIELYGLKGHRLKRPGPPDARAASAQKKEYFAEWYPSALEFLDTSQYDLKKDRFKKTAFELHQACERLYACFLLVHTLYSPATHNIKRLRSLAEDINPALIEAFPRNDKQSRTRFELLKEAYVKARYSKYYDITQDDLVWLTQRITKLAEAEEKACAEHMGG